MAEQPVGEVAGDAAEQQAERDLAGQRATSKWCRVRKSATKASSMTMMSVVLLPLNRLHAAPVLPQWTNLKKPGMMIFSSPA